MLSLLSFPSQKEKERGEKAWPEEGPFFLSFVFSEGKNKRKRKNTHKMQKLGGINAPIYYFFVFFSFGQQKKAKNQNRAKAEVEDHHHYQVYGEKCKRFVFKFIIEFEIEFEIKVKIEFEIQIQNQIVDLILVGYANFSSLKLEIWHVFGMFLA